MSIGVGAPAECWAGPAGSATVARWASNLVPTGHCDVAPHDRGTASRRRAGAQLPAWLEEPCGDAVRGQ
jgi:hypothetical protein